MRLTDLHPRFVGAGGEGVYRQTGRLCPTCNGVVAADCPTCHGTGKEYEPAPRREGVGVIFRCPCGNGADEHECYVPFRNPLDGGPPADPGGWNGSGGWQRTGDTFETLTLTPSILRNRSHGGCGWHGFITNGEVTGQVEP
ncbi:MAG: DUF6527 family protein [Vicinamibacterales bacterium]